MDDRLVVWRVVCDLVDRKKEPVSFQQIYDRTAFTRSFTRKVIKEMLKRSELIQSVVGNEDRYKHHVAVKG